MQQPKVVNIAKTQVISRWQQRDIWNQFVLYSRSGSYLLLYLLYLLWYGRFHSSVSRMPWIFFFRICTGLSLRTFCLKNGVKKSIKEHVLQYYQWGASGDIDFFAVVSLWDISARQEISYPDNKVLQSLCFISVSFSLHFTPAQSIIPCIQNGPSPHCRMISLPF